MDDYKARITKIVQDYIQAFPAEYDRFRNSVKQKQEHQHNKYGLAKETQIELRALYDVPETLDTSLELLLPADALEWLRTRDGGRWFAKKFRTFAVAEKI